MSATNLTKNLKLSQFVASDKPSWLGDVNGDNKKIDDGYGVLAGEISKANDTASSAKSQSDANTQTLTNVNSELEDYGNRITALEAGGGTEQLEQRVNTISTDVEALQTRADTFEENISQNGTDITALKGRVDTIEPKVKANADNITSLQTSNTNILSEIEGLHTVNTENGKLITNAQTTATTANNKADSNTVQINSIKTQLDNISDSTTSSMKDYQGLGTSKLATAGSAIIPNSINCFFCGNNLYFLPFVLAGDLSFCYDSYKSVFTVTLPSGINSVIFGTGESSAVQTVYISAVNSKGSCYWELSGTTLTFYLKVGRNYGGPQFITPPSLLIN